MSSGKRRSPVCEHMDEADEFYEEFLEVINLSMVDKAYRIHGLTTWHTGKHPSDINWRSRCKPTEDFQNDIVHAA
ncbi:hypothetical protein BaRGS_00018375 [Batillaria attramentaria]|uniref:Uncharacterized protein n=1 Tax=Batillaria attramentaria TaxID=370345 RepID=A0ABD0KTI8_9CAEN